MSKKKSVKTIMIVLGIVIIAVLGFFAWNYNPVQNTAITGDMVNGASGVVCPDGYSCEAQPILSCTTPSGDQPNVLLRCDYYDTWFAMDTSGDGNLEFYQKATSSSTIAKSTPYTPIYCCGNTCIGTGNNQYGVIDKTNNKYLIVYQKSTPPNTNLLQSTPLTGYESKEVLGGNTNIYQCSQDVFKNDRVLATLSYSSSRPTTNYAPYIYPFNAKEVLRFNGNMVFAKTKLAVNTCTAPTGTMNTGQAVCNENKLYSCATPILGGDAQLKTTDCSLNDLKCNPVTLKCEEPYTVSLKVNGQSPSGTFQMLGGSAIKVEFTLNEAVPQRRNVVVSLTKAGAIISSTSDDTNKITRTLTLTAPSTTGYYDLEIYMNHPDKIYEQKYTVQVVQGVNAVVSSLNPVQFDNQAIQLKLESYQGGLRVPIYDYEFQASFRNSAVQPSTTRNPSLGIYEAYYNLKDEGILRARARVQYEQNGAWSDWSDYYEVQVKKASITIVPSFQTDIVAGTYTFSFETRDSTGQLVDTANTVQLESAGGTSTLQTSKQSTGKYNIDVNFPTGGLYYIKITSNAPTIGSSQLNNGIGQAVNILSTGSGGSGGGTSGVNWLMWTLFGIIGSGIGIIIFTIIRNKKGGKR